MNRVALMFVVVSCGGRPDVFEPSSSQPLPAHHEATLDSSPKTHRRMVPPEAFLRAYLGWFGGLAPFEVAKRARGFGLFDQWTDYLAALGLPDYHIDTPRVTQSNSMMLATLGRLGEALCVRAAEHDFHKKTEPQVVYGFDLIEHPTIDDFTPRFDVLHRTFLSYPSSLAPADRVVRFFQLYTAVAARHTTGHLHADEAAWAAVCTALIQHPEAGLY